MYEYNGTSWVQRGQDIDGAAAGDLSGYSVSISGDGSIVAIGARDNDNNGSGHVRVYEYNGTSWVQRGQDIDGEAAGDFSGWSVSISADGTTVAIGATNNEYNRGHVRVYHWNNSIWVQRGQDIDGEAADDYSGWSVSISADGTTVAIGAYGHANYRGHVRVYEYNGTSWVQLGADIDSEAVSDQSGYSVSISADGSTVAIGAVYNNNFSGHVRVYHWNGTNWVQRGVDIDGETAGDFSGWSVSISADGSTVAIGAIGNNSYRGHVRVYHWNNLSWVQRGQDIDGEAAGDYSGWSVSISADGTTVAISAAQNDGNGSNSGHVRVYEYEVDISLTPMELSYLKNTSSNIQTQIDTISAAVSAEAVARASAITSAVSAEAVARNAALDLKAHLENPAFIGTVTAPTVESNDNSTKVATTAYVTTAVSAEAAARNVALDLKAPLANPTFTGTVAFTDTVTAPTVASSDNSTNVATTAYVNTAISAVTDSKLTPGSSNLVVSDDQLITVTNSYHTLTCSGSTATLSTINGGSIGSLLHLDAEFDKEIHVDGEVGNILLTNSPFIIINRGIRQSLTLIKKTNYDWYELSRTQFGGRPNASISVINAILYGNGDNTVNLSANVSTNSSGQLMFRYNGTIITNPSEYEVNFEGIRTILVDVDETPDRDSNSITFVVSNTTTDPSLHNFQNINKTTGDESFNINQPNTNSSGSFSYTSSNPDVATISGNTVTIVGVGVTTITATQASYSNYSSASISATLTVI